MNGPPVVKRGEPGKSLVGQIDSEILSIRKQVQNTLVLAKRVDQLSGDSVADSQANTLLTDLDRVLSGAESRITEPSLLVEFRSIVARAGELRYQRRERPVDPPVRFKRIERFAAPLVDSFRESPETETPSGLELWLDNMFSNDAIYDEAIKGLRDRCVQLSEHTAALERNLDEAEAEIQYWRERADHQVPSEKEPVQTESRRVQTDPAAKRVVEEKLWKHAIAKFIGSFDQFSQLKVFLHWKMYVKESLSSKKT